MKNKVNNLDRALDLIYKAGQDSGHDFERWCETELTDHLVELAHMYTGHTLLNAVVLCLKESHSVHIENLTNDYDENGLDEFGENNEHDKEDEEFTRLTLADLEPALANWEARSFGG